MIKSMTGFGRGRALDSKQNAIEVELKSINHKFLEVSPRLPNDLSFLETKILSYIRQKISRGKIFLTIVYRRESYQDLVLNAPLLKRYQVLMKQMKRQFGIKDQIEFGHLVSLPDLFIKKESKKTSRQYWVVVKRALDQALNELLRNRKQEGDVLKKELSGRLRNIHRSVMEISKRLPKAIKEYRRTLARKLKKYSEATKIDPQKTEMELAVHVKNSDITEELVRLGSHVDYFQRSLRSNSEIGKKLDFIAQEMHRETNTIGSKANDAQIARAVIAVKGEIDKLREQVQNIE